MFAKSVEKLRDSSLYCVALRMTDSYKFKGGVGWGEAPSNPSQLLISGKACHAEQSEASRNFYRRIMIKNKGIRK
ncbi:MAG: hypothetical protein EA393_07880 [Bacteroidetes bacterium]|nr:MAG: hypothetical protein EA393_07880 [Bacteroidota bacterium]